MLDPAIQYFLDERKGLWLKKNLTPNISEEEHANIEKQAAELFSLAVWLPDAAKRAKQLSMVSHPGKFTHPSAKISPIIATAQHKADGYLRTGNVNVAVELDVLGNAAAMDVYKFLMLILSDGQSVLQHLEQRTDTITQQFTLPHVSYEDLAAGLLAIKQTDTGQLQTSGHIKQVYFPVDMSSGEYHLLSVLTSSGMLYELKARLNTLRFSEETTAAREAKKKEAAHPNGYSDITDLVAIGFGGTKPQNISILNNQNGGVANLLYSMPPFLEKKRFSPPRYDFFTNTLRLAHFSEDFQSFHQQSILDKNNMYIRNNTKQTIKDIIYKVIDTAWRVRRLDIGWTQAERYQALPQYQKIWLDQYYQTVRSEETQWLDTVKVEIARWFMGTYKQLFKDEAAQWDDESLFRLKQMVAECEESLK